jgi:L-aspartate oxidase
LRTTNPHTSTGDGIALAYEAGAEIGNMEFMQFHPTAFYTKSGETFLISEAVRGEGAYLVNKTGKRFMPEYHESAELAPRDVVSRAIFQQMKEHKTDNVYLDLRHLDSAKIKKRFSNIYKETSRFGIDMTSDLVPVAPAAHYTIGGIRTGLNAETNIKGLYACGEVTHSGVHGANRLASNSLLECIVFGKRAVDASLREPVSLNKDAADEELIFNLTKKEEFTSIKNRIAGLMNDKVGIVRNDELMNEAITQLTEIENNFKFEKDEYFSKRLSSLLSVSRLIINSALLRKESRGTHIREDFPEESPEMLYYIIQHKDEQPKFLPINN